MNDHSRVNMKHASVLLRQAADYLDHATDETILSSVLVSLGLAARHLREVEGIAEATMTAQVSLRT
jgi:hypothetical protein